MLAKHADSPGKLGPVEAFMAAIAAVPRAAQRLQAARLQRSFAERLADAQVRRSPAAVLLHTQHHKHWHCLEYWSCGGLLRTQHVIFAHVVSCWLTGWRGAAERGVPRGPRQRVPPACPRSSSGHGCEAARKPQ